MMQGASSSVVFFEAKALARSRLTFTYSVSARFTDVGFGCMLRALQMLLAHSLRLTCVEEDDEAWLTLFVGSASSLADSLRAKPGYAEMIALFSDANEGMFSLSQLVKAGSKFGIHSWSWYSPRIACLIACDIMNSGDDGALIIHVATDRTVFQLECETLFEGGSTEGEHGKAVLLLIPARLGAETIEEHLRGQLVSWLRDPRCVGLIGGPGSRGLYSFATTEDDTLLCLDPHTTIRMEMGDVPNSPPSDEFIHACHNDSLGEVTVEELNPECALGFLFKDKGSFVRWAAVHRTDAKAESSRSGAIFTVFEGAPPKKDFPSRSSNEGSDGEDEEDDWKVI